MENLKKELSKQQIDTLLETLKKRFYNYMNRHEGLEWDVIKHKLETQPEKIWSLHVMEETGGEPDVVGHEQGSGIYLFFDCSSESPKGRRSLCYDRAAWESRREHKPADNALDMASAMGIEILTEEQYRYLQTFEPFDTKTSSWVMTPARIRHLGGALFCDCRYNTVFVYHNGAESYYASRGFRGVLKV